MKNIDDFFASGLKAELEKMPRGGQNRLSEATNIFQQTISGTIKRTRNIPEEGKHKVAKYFGYEYDEFLRMGKAILEGKEYNAPDEFLVTDEMLEDGFIKIPFSNDMKLAAGGGGQIITTHEASVSTLVVHGPSLGRRNSKGLHAFRVGGDSMEPLIANGGIVLVNTSENDIRKLQDGKIYVICWDLYSGECAVKIVKWAEKDKLLALVSANNFYNPEFKKASEITLVGRVIWAWREF